METILLSELSFYTDLSFFADGELVPRVKAAELLGVIVDDSLHFTNHILKSCKKIGKRM